jgi:hypothetical protein
MGGYNAIPAQNQLASRTYDGRSVTDIRALPDSDRPALCKPLVSNWDGGVFIFMVLVYDQHILCDDDITF